MENQTSSADVLIHYPPCQPVAHDWYYLRSKSVVRRVVAVGSLSHYECSPLLLYHTWLSNIVIPPWKGPVICPRVNFCG